MKTFSISPITLLVIPFFLSWTSYNEQWNAEGKDGFRIIYTSADNQNKDEYAMLIENGSKTVTGFFHGPFQSDFDVFIHPNRHSLDSTWQYDWKMPEFKSECWMVASGIADRMDMISPKTWEGLATFASGKCDAVRVAEVKKAIADGKVPSSLGQFWSGRLKYGLSGSMVMYIDHKYGRAKLISLLGYTDISDLLEALGTTEADLLKGWSEFLL